MKAIFTLVLAFLAITEHLYTQELVPNNGFESYQGIGKCAPWTGAAGDFNHFYHHRLNNKHQGAAHGGGYYGLCMYSYDVNEFLHVKLLQPLQKGKVYTLSMMVRLSDTTDEVYKDENLELFKRLDWYFTSIPIDVSQKLLITAEPSVSFPFVYPQPVSWTPLSTEYVARGDERYLTIGNITRMYELMNLNPELMQLKNQLAQNNENEERETDSVKTVYRSKMDPPMQDPSLEFSMNPYIKTKKVSKKKEKQYRAHIEKNNRYMVQALEEEKKIRLRYNVMNEKLEKEMENLKGPQQYKVNVCFDDISIQEITGKTAQVKDSLTQMEAVTGNTFVLKQVYFDTDSYVLLENSFAELDQLIGWLQQHPSTTIQVNGHTDNTGSAAHNQQLSQNRAKAVMDYLVNNGIDAARVWYKGYGAQYPLADNTTDQGKALNRRVEFTVL